MVKNKSASIKDVAEAAGVSATTVSRVINQSSHPVNEKTKKRVKQAINRLNYQPNRLAQGLKNNKSKIIGVIVHDISDPYFAQIVKGIETITFDNDYIVNIINTERDIEKELKAVNMLKANRAEAIVFTGGNLIDSNYFQKMKKHVEKLKKQGTCLLGITSHPFDFENIEIGNYRAAKMATEFLIKKGHEKIGYITGPEILNTSRGRFKGFRQALKEKSIKFKESLVINGDFTFEGGRKAAQKIIYTEQSITALVASNDETALGLMWQLRKKSIKVPERISVIGIGDIPSSKYATPPLTTVFLPLYDLGKRIGNYLTKTLNETKGGNEFQKNINIEIGLKERDSVLKIN